MNTRNILMLALCSVSLAACTRVDPGHVGIKVNNFGSGTQAEPLGVGYYYAGPGSTIYEYPVYTSTHTWTKDPTEGSPTNEEFSFQDRNGLSVQADIAVAYHTDHAKAPILFEKYRRDMQAIVDGPLRIAVRDALIRNASLYNVEEIYGVKKAELLSKAFQDVKNQLAPFGLDVESLSWASDVRIPDAVKRQINQKIANEQAALAAQASVATARANADAHIAEAEGKAKAMQIEANAISTNPQVLQLRAIEKWDGKYPQYVGGGMPLPTLKAN